MPAARRDEAMTVVREVLEANSVVDFHWYKTRGTRELACYWDDAAQNLLWVTVNKVHILCDPSVQASPALGELAER